jgi:hypothetical protein
MAILSVSHGAPAISLFRVALASPTEPCAHAAGTVRVGKCPCLIGKRPCLIGTRPYLMRKRPCLIGTHPCLIGMRTFDWKAPVFDWEAPVFDLEAPLFDWKASVFDWKEFDTTMLLYYYTTVLLCHYTSILLKIILLYHSSTILYCRARETHLLVDEQCKIHLFGPWPRLGARCSNWGHAPNYSYSRRVAIHDSFCRRAGRGRRVA